MRAALLLLLVGGSDAGWGCRQDGDRIYCDTNSNWGSRWAGDLDWPTAGVAPGPMRYTITRSDGGVVSITSDDVYDLVLWAREARRIGCLHAPDAGSVRR